MQASVALSALGQTARIGALGIGLGLILFAALRSSALLPQGVAINVSLALCMCAVAFEALSAFNGHLVFEPKLIAFRAICYLLIASGVVIGLAASAAHGEVAATAITTAIVVLIALAAPLTWRSLQEIILIEGTRGSFDESSPVALGFSSGTLAVAALVIALRSTNIINYALGAAGFGGWTLICMQSGSRGALFSLALTALFLLAIGFSAAPKRTIALIALATMVVSGRAVVDSTFANQAGYVFERFESVLSLEADASIAGSADSRAYLLEHNLNLPGLFVLGGEGFDPEAYPHNFEVEAFVRLGVPLGILFLAAAIYLLGCGVRFLISCELNLGVGMILSLGLFTFFNAQTNMMWEFLRPLWMCLGLMAGMVLHRRIIVGVGREA
jgi:hypothetical protein